MSSDTLASAFHIPTGSPLRTYFFISNWFLRLSPNKAAVPFPIPSILSHNFCPTQDMAVGTVYTRRGIKVSIREKHPDIVEVSPYFFDHSPFISPVIVEFIPSDTHSAVSDTNVRSPSMTGPSAPRSFFPIQLITDGTNPVSFGTNEIALAIPAIGTLSSIFALFLINSNGCPDTMYAASPAKVGNTAPSILINGVTNLTILFPTLTRTPSVFSTVSTASSGIASLLTNPRSLPSLEAT